MNATLTFSALLVIAASAAASVSSQEPTTEMPPPRATYYVALYDAGPAWVQGLPPLAQPGIQEHGVYMDQLHSQGHLPLGGPLVRGEQGAPMELAGALLVIDARSLDEARALVLADPALKADIMRLRELHPFLVYIGGVAERTAETDRR